MQEICGTITALVTPFNGHKIDEPNLRRLIDWQIAQGISGLVPCGTTGESPVLDEAEQKHLIAVTVDQCAGRVPVIAGAGTNDTRKTLQLAQNAAKAGADALLVILPYYNKPNPEGVYLHFKHLNDYAGLPIIIYNNPARTIIDMQVMQMARLAELPNIIGVKDATGDLARPTHLAAHLPASKTFVQLSGDDATALPFLAAGGVGCISVTANIAPKLCVSMQDAYRDNDMKTAQHLHRKMIFLHKLLFAENSPGPVKYGTHLLGFGSWETRLPLAPISDKLKLDIKATMQQLGLC